MNEPKLMKVSNDGVEWTTRIVVCEAAGKAIALDAESTHIYSEFQEQAVLYAELAAWDVWKELDEPKTRPMTPDEILAWACSKDALGWCVRIYEGSWLPPQSLLYRMFAEECARRRINKDGSMGPIEKFEVECGD